MSWLKQNWKKYLPDTLVLLGSYLLAKGIFTPPSTSGLQLPKLTFTDYHTDEKIWGTVLIVFGIIIAIRKLSSKWRPS